MDRLRFITDCIDADPWPVWLFGACAFVLYFMVARHNNFGLKDALWAALGRKHFERNTAITVMMAVTVVIPLMGMYSVVKACAP